MVSPSITRSRRKARFLTAKIERIPEAANSTKDTRFGTSLRPVPPGASKGKDTRDINIHEDDGLDEAQMANWVKQAAALPDFLRP